MYTDTFTLYMYLYKCTLFQTIRNHKHRHPRAMQFLSACMLCVLCVYVVMSKGSYAKQLQNDGVLMKNISDLHFQLFSSIQKKTKTIKVKNWIIYPIYENMRKAKYTWRIFVLKSVKELLPPLSIKSPCVKVKVFRWLQKSSSLRWYFFK